MPRLLLREAVFEAVSQDAFWESELQAVLAVRSETVFPGFWYVPFQCKVHSEHGPPHEPDFMLVEKEYRSWWVVEMESVRHSLVEHVLRQVKCFRDGVYGPEHTEYACARNPNLDPIRLSYLIDSTRPGILVVADKHRHRWEVELAREHVELSIFQAYRRVDRADYIFSVDGFAPEGGSELLTKLRCDPFMPRMLQLRNPAVLEGPSGRKLEIFFEGELSAWILTLAEDKGWLQSKSGHVFEPDATYALVQTAQAILRIERR
jgi:hypothetical protein